MLMLFNPVFRSVDLAHLKSSVLQKDAHIYVCSRYKNSITLAASIAVVVAISATAAADAELS